MKATLTLTQTQRQAGRLVVGWGSVYRPRRRNRRAHNITRERETSRACPARRAALLRLEWRREIETREREIISACRCSAVCRTSRVCPSSVIIIVYNIVLGAALRGVQRKRGGVPKRGFQSKVCGWTLFGEGKVISRPSGVCCGGCAWTTVLGLAGCSDDLGR